MYVYFLIQTTNIKNCYKQINHKINILKCVRDIWPQCGRYVQYVIL